MNTVIDFLGAAALACVVTAFILFALGALV